MKRHNTLPSHHLIILDLGREREKVHVFVRSESEANTVGTGPSLDAFGQEIAGLTGIFRSDKGTTELGANIDTTIGILTK